MVSPLWVAAADGDIDQVTCLLKEASLIDIEIKDEAGATPLVQAVKNGHGHVVKALLNAGADLSVSSNYGTLEQLTADATILELLDSEKVKRLQANPAATACAPSDGYSQEYPADPEKTYYAQPHGSYMYYPPYHLGAALLPDGTPAPYYPPPPPSAAGQPPEATGGTNLPPPEIARLIPCRYFPACRYGPSCIFAHPQGPYFQGPLPPPAQYTAPYDPVAQPPYGGCYATPQTPYPPNNVASSMGNPMSPPLASHQLSTPPPNHVRASSEILSPLQATFSPSAAPPMPYSMSVPTAYSQLGQMPLPPVPVGMTALPPPQQSAARAVQPNGTIYQPTSSIVQPAAMHRREPSTATLQNGPFSQGPATDGSAPNHSQSIPPQQDAYANGARPYLRDGLNHARRGSVRRLSTTGSSRKPPCAFFPSGRCRNGESCRFPHIMPDSGDVASGHFTPKFGARGKPHSPPAADQLRETNSGPNSRTDSTPSAPQPNGQPNGITRPHPQNNSKVNGSVNGARHDKRNGGPRLPQPQQRVPNADDFPVLAGSITPPARSPGAPPLNGPTAAQVLQAPPPTRKDSAKSQTQVQAEKNGNTFDEEQMSSPDGPPKANDASNDHLPNGINDINGSAHDIKSPLFAAVATVAATIPDSASTVSVSA